MNWFKITAQPNYLLTWTACSKEDDKSVELLTTKLHSLINNQGSHSPKTCIRLNFLRARFITRLLHLKGVTSVTNSCFSWEYFRFVADDRMDGRGLLVSFIT
jgi:hypothetical protein